ncbi:uncharacterized protein [Aquarana catesbeiana]|uniref:uncharacterized protein n=1 Tax=Aquarana catesbeiana TaxID=8400 RepID=UPI003CC98504
MSEKDTVSSQDIPALVRALGTLALAAATAVVIKWFISHDTKEEKTESCEADLKNNLCSTVQDEQTMCDGGLIFDGVQVKNTNPLEVSDGDGKKVNLLLEDCHDFGYYRAPTETSCISQSTTSEQEKGQQINLYCAISPKKTNQITSVACKLNMVAASPANSALFIQTEDGCNASVLTATTRGSSTNATEDQMFSGCLTHKCDSLLFESSASIQELECSFGTCSSDGEYNDDLNTRCSGSQYKLIGQDIPVTESFVQHSTVSIGCGGQNLVNGPNGKKYVLNCDSEINVIQCITPEEQKYNIDNLVIDGNNEDSTLVSSTEISEEKIVKVLCNPFASEAEMSIRTDICIPNCHSAPVIFDIAAQVTVNSAVENDTFRCTEMLSHVQNTLSAENENVISVDGICKDSKQNATLHSKMDSQYTNIYQSDEGEKLTLTDCKVTKIPNEDLKLCIEDAVQNTNDDDNDTKNRVLSLENIMRNKGNNSQKFVTSMDANTGRYEAQESFQGSSQCGAINAKEENMTDNTHCYPNNTEILPMSEEWRANTLYNNATQTAVMYPLDLEVTDASFNIQGKQCEHQFYAEEMSVVLKNIRVAKDLSTNFRSEKTHEDIDNDNEESIGLYCTTSNAAYAMTTLENNMNESTSPGTISSKVMNECEFISGVKSINDQNWHTCTAKHQEGSNVITNGYLDINHEVTDENEKNVFSKMQEEYCSKDNISLASEPCSSLLNTVFLTTGSSSKNTTFFKDSNVPLPSMMEKYNTVQIGQHNTNGENYVFQESFSIDRDEQPSSVGDTFSSCTKHLAKDKQNDPMCCDSNLGSTQDQNICLTVNNFTSLCPEKRDDSREKIMSIISENPELILPEYQSKFKMVKKKPLMTKSCDNILSGHSYQEPTLKTKAQSMLCFLTEYYSSKLPSENGPVEEVARGSFIRIPKSLQSTGEAIRFHLTLGNCLELLKLARKNRVQELLKAVYTVISDNYLNVLKNSAVYGQLTGLERERILQLRMRGKLSLCVVETKSIFCLNKYIPCPVEKADHTTHLYSLDNKTNKWKCVTNIPEEACLKGCGICSMHNYLFIAGGLKETTDGLTCSNKLVCYNPLTDIWTQLSPMNEGRSQLKLIPLDGYLYAIGGECLHTVEKYDPRSNKWTFVAPLPKGTFAVAHEAAACGGEIYISGGHLFYRLLKYSPVHDQWVECPFNASKGRSCDMVAVGSILYRFDMHKDSSVNILKYNTMGKMWSEYTTTFPGSKIPFRCALFEGNIYCINRETTAKFSLEYEKAVFEAGVFSKVPTSGAGSPHPTVLCLCGSVSQTSV